MEAADQTHTRRGRSRRALVAWLAAGLVVAFLAASGALLAVEPPPALAARLVARFPAVVPGTPPKMALPPGGQSAIATADGQVLASTAAEQPAPLASVTKVMTAFVVLHDHPLRPGQPGPEITVTAAEAASVPARAAQGESLVPVTAGEQLDEMQALQALLIPSADNVADILARFDAGSQAAFVAKMNSWARRLGMDHTHYVDASGLDAGSVSTATDQLVLARAAMKLPVLAEIVDERTADIPVAGTVTNYNGLLGQDGFTGIKTGSTGPAGGCLMFSVTRTVDGTPVTLRGMVMGQRGGPFVAAALSAARSLADAAFADFGPRTVLPAGTRVFEVSRAGHRAWAVTARPLVTVYPAGVRVRLSVSPQRPVRFSARTGPSATVTLDQPGPSTSAGVRLAGRLPAPSLGWSVEHLY